MRMAHDTMLSDGKGQFQPVLQATTRPQAMPQQRQSLSKAKQQQQQPPPQQPPPQQESQAQPTHSSQPATEPAARRPLPHPRHRLAHGRPVAQYKPGIRLHRPLHAGRAAPVCAKCAGPLQLPGNATLSLHLGAPQLSCLAKLGNVIGRQACSTAACLARQGCN